jgi:CRISPR-associated Csx2 family protein
MPRKIFISFLGITKYVKARYYFETEGTHSAGEPENFVQISLLKMLKDVFGPDDKAFIFLTSMAEEKNWIDNANFEEGLQTRLQHLHNNGILKGTFKPVTGVPEGFTSKEIEDLFQMVLKKIEPGDEVYLDITYAFRHIPMLALTLLNFATAVKQIQLKAIYYGAFEKILNDYEKRTGEKISFQQLEQKINEEERYAPILNLSTLEELQQWSFAARSFTETGNTFFLSKLIQAETEPLLQPKKQTDPEAEKLSSASFKLTEVAGNIATCRGKRIEARTTVELAIDKMRTMKADGTFVKPFEELIGTVLEKFAQLINENYPPWFNAVKWCRQHRLIQQGVTLLQEGIITLLIQQFNQPTVLHTGNRKHRDIVAAAFNIRKRKIARAKWNESAANNEQLILQLFEMPKFDVLASAYMSISEKRNYINHGGFLDEDNTDPFHFEQALKNSIVRMEEEFFA